MMDGEIEVYAIAVSDRVMSRWKRAMIAPSNSPAEPGLEAADRPIGKISANVARFRLYRHRYL